MALSKVSLRRAPKSFRAASSLTLTPLVVLGILPMAYGLIVGLEWATVFGALLVGGAGGDLAIFHAMRSAGPAVLVRDHPTEPGFIVVGGSGSTR